MRLACLLVCSCIAWPAHGLEVGQQVLARYNLREDLFHYPARVVSLLPRDAVLLAYDGGGSARMPRAALVTRPLCGGDLVRVDGRHAAVRSVGLQGRLTLRMLDGSGAIRSVARGQVKVLLRTDHGLTGAAPAPLALGARVLAKWDTRAWYVGTLIARQGEARCVRFADGVSAWIPANLVCTLSLRVGRPVFGVNPRDGQPIPGRLEQQLRAGGVVRFFDGARRAVPFGRLLTLKDQPAVDQGDPCVPTAGRPDRRPAAATLRSWLARRIHFYDHKANDARVAVSADHLEVVLVLFLPVDRKPIEGWRRTLTLLASQVRAFLVRALGAWATIEVRAFERPVVGGQTLAWYRAELNETDRLQDWGPTRDCLRAVFPGGPRAGRHRVLVTVPDAPGLSQDDSGVEGGIGFVRLRGHYFRQTTPDGVRRLGAGQRTYFDRWTPNYLASTMVHEVLHTIGLPHSDGDPWSMMNLGCWYPIRRKEVHLARLHQLVLRSPFRRSLSLSQGYAQYLIDPNAAYLELVRQTERIDTDLRLRYAGGRGLFRLGPILTSFGPETAARQGGRAYTGDRAICRAYLASFIAFVVARHGVAPLRSLFDASDEAALGLICERLGQQATALERAWHTWLRERLQ